MVEELPYIGEKFHINGSHVFDEIQTYLPAILLLCVASTPSSAKEFYRLSTLQLTSTWENLQDLYYPQTILATLWEELNAESGNEWFTEILENLRFPSLLEKPKRCKAIVSIANNLNWCGINPEEILAYFEAILHCLETTERDLIEPLPRTPSWLVNLLVTLLAPQAGESIYDPQCGVGDLLFTAYQAAQIPEGGTAPMIYGQNWDEYDNFHIGIAKGAAILRNIEHAHFTVGRIRATQQFSDGEPLIKYDSLITASLPNYESALIQVFNCMKDSGRAVVAISEDVLYRQEYSQLRADFIEKDVTEAVITLPVYIMKTEPTAILILNKAKPVETKGRIRLIHAMEMYQGYSSYCRQDLSNIIDATRSEEDIKGCAKWVDLQQVHRLGFILRPDRYIDVAGVEDFMGGMTTRHTLAEIAKVTRKETRWEDNFPVADKSDTDDTPVVGAGDTTRSNIRQNDLVQTSDDAEYLTLIDNDILISAEAQDQTVYLCDSSMVGSVVDNSLYLLRLNKDYQMLAAYLVEYLRSDTGSQQLKMAKRERPAYEEEEAISEILEIQIPIPEPGVLAVVNAIRNVESRLEERVEAVRKLRLQLFNVKDPEKLNQELETLNIQANVLDASILQLEDLNFQLRNYFPFPIVYAYRLLNAITENSAHYGEQMRVAENLLAFLATIGLSLTHHLGLLDNTTTETLTQKMLKQAWQGGISPGHLREQAYACAKLMKDHQLLPAINSFASVWFKGKKVSDFFNDTGKLVQLKNDYKHDRGPKTPEEYEEAIVQADLLLKNCFSQLRFLTQYSLHLVEDLDFDHWTSTYTLTTLAYNGDHPGMQQVITQGLSRPLTKGLLYIALDRDTWIPLYPLISVQYCPQCKMRETYFIDLWDGPGKPAQLKSFERGHVHRDDKAAEQVGKDLERWLNSHFSE